MATRARKSRAVSLRFWDQARGGWNGGAEEMPKRLCAAVMGGSDWTAIRDSTLSGRLTIASGLGAQMDASAQFGAGGSDGVTVL
jgi:hypothetical protein